MSKLKPIKPWANHIYLSGQLGSGKGYCEAVLVERDYKPIAWSDGVYQMVAEQAGVSVEAIRANKSAYRDQLQAIGHGMRIQSGNENYWVDQREATASRYERTVESGTRYPNECRVGLKRGIVINIHANFMVRMERYQKAYGSLPTQAQLDHPNEALARFLPCTATFDNSAPDTHGFTKTHFTSTVLMASQMEPWEVTYWDRLRVCNIIAALLTAKDTSYSELGLSEESYGSYRLELVYGNGDVSMLPPTLLADQMRLNVALQEYIRRGEDSALLAATVRAQRIGFRGKFVGGLLALLKETAQHEGYSKTLEFLG